MIPLLGEYNESAEKESSMEKIGQLSHSSYESLDDAEALVIVESDTSVNPELTEVEVSY